MALFFFFKVATLNRVKITGNKIKAVTRNRFGCQSNQAFLLVGYTMCLSKTNGTRNSIPLSGETIFKRTAPRVSLPCHLTAESWRQWLME